LYVIVPPPVTEQLVSPRLAEVPEEIVSGEVMEHVGAPAGGGSVVVTQVTVVPFAVPVVCQLPVQALLSLIVTVNGAATTAGAVAIATVAPAIARQFRMKLGVICSS
jgi:hypothetical protein